ncbi:sirohydrochlorin cobaltochelatase [Fusobacterium sp. MFO224]|uniref:sirohydrochlorin cobaltochelatase n=1 Tax=Fusobacterium sp. MFO224 TaxID=3378070 RepID=UPI003853038A
MKKMLISLFLMASLTCLANDEGGFVKSNLKENMNKNDKASMLIVHFGTTFDDTRAKTIDALNNDAKDEFKDFKVTEAYTSRIIMRRLKERGIEKNNPAEVLDKLVNQGYTHLIVQSSNIIPGIEFKTLEKQVEMYNDKFKEIRIGHPLLAKTENYKKVLTILKNDIGELNKNEAVVLVGHGTHDSANSTYACVDYVAKDLDLPFYVGTIEGYPTIDNVIKNLKKDNIKKVILTPFMFVAGDHANNDIAVDWKETLEKNGFAVKNRVKGLGEIKEIRNLMLENAEFMTTHKEEDMISKKLFYSKQKDN